MKSIHIFVASILLCIFFTSLSSEATEIWKATDLNLPGYLPKEGFVPDKATAISIAIAVLTPIYGRDTIAAERPLIATLENGVWTVTGSLPAGHVGGVAEIRIEKASGKILRVGHGK